jgi:hypothetical protein
MALTAKETRSKTPSSTPPSRPSGSPGYTAPLFFIGVLLVFLGERVFVTLNTARVISTTLGAGLMLTTTVIRWVMGARAKGDRGRIERLLGIAQMGACFAIAVALASTLTPSTLGLEALDAEKREFTDNVLLIGWVLLLLVSLLPLGFAESALIPMRKAVHPESRRVVAAASAGLTIALALGYLGLFVGAAHQYGVAADFAFFKTAKPSASTTAIAKSLKEPVRVVAFFPSMNEVKNEVDRYLREVSRNNPKLKVEFIDRVLQPKVAREMRVSQDGTIVLSRGEVRQMINVGVELKNARTTLRNFDQEFQKNLMKLSRDARVAYLTIGHREINDSTTSDEGKPDKSKGVTILRKLLEMQNYRILDLGMPQGLGREIPADANVVIVLGPKDPFAAEEVAALKQYVDRGGALMLGLDPEALPAVNTTVDSSPVPSTSARNSDGKAPNHDAKSAEAQAQQLNHGGIGPNLNELAALLGLAIEPSILANDRGDTVAFAGNKSDLSRIVTNRFSSHASVSTLSRHSAWVVLFGTGSLKKLDEKDKTIDFALHSTTTTFADQNGNFAFDSTEKRQSFEIAAAVTRPGKSEGGAKPVERRGFVIADADLFSDAVLKNVPTNRFLLLDAVRWLGGEESLSGEVNSEDDVRIEHTKDKDVFWFYLTIFGVPALVLLVGLLVSRKAKRKGESR